MIRILVALATLFALAATPAAAVPHKAGYWDVGANGEGATSCSAIVKVGDDLSFSFVGVGGQVSFVMQGKGLRRGRLGTFEPDGETFEFKPAYDGREFLFLDGELGDEATTAVRTAKRLRITIDDKRLAEMLIADTGVPEVLDALVACSKGEAGWWGKGATVATKPAVNREGGWAVVPLEGIAGACSIVGRIDNRFAIGFYIGQGGLGFSVDHDRSLRRVRGGTLQMDGLSTSFRAKHDDDSYFYSDDPLDSQAVFVLRRAKVLRVSFDGREGFVVDLANTGFADALTAAEACARGEKGWWGEGAKRP